MPSGSRPPIWGAKADADLDEIWDYLTREASPSIAEKQIRDVYRVVANLADWPRIGRERNDLRIGLRSVTSPPYIIFYRLRDSRAEIVRVLHGRRDIGRILANEPET